MPCLMVDFCLSGVPPALGFELTLESWAAEKGENFLLHLGPTSKLFWYNWVPLTLLAAGGEFF